jgi:hypothetical protein
MKRRAVVTGLVCVCLLAPSLARADDGGWWDNFWRFDPKLTGYSTEFHLLCKDKQGRRVIGCEEWFKGLYSVLVRQQAPTHHFKALKDSNATDEDSQYDLVQFEDIKQEVDFRVGYYRNYGNRYNNPNESSIQGSIKVQKFEGFYHYHITDFLALGAGVGYLQIYGDRFDLFSRSILTPVSVVGYMPPLGSQNWKVLEARFEVNYIPKGFTAADFGDAADPNNPSKTVSHFSNTNEWNITLSIGYDLRRIGSYDK